MNKHGTESMQVCTWEVNGGSFKEQLPKPESGAFLPAPSLYTAIPRKPQAPFQVSTRNPRSPPKPLCHHSASVTRLGQKSGI